MLDDRSEIQGLQFVQIDLAALDGDPEIICLSLVAGDKRNVGHTGFRGHILVMEVRVVDFQEFFHVGEYILFSSLRCGKEPQFPAFVRWGEV